MLTRPLDLASRLRPPPRNFDYVFLINLGLIALFFVVFDSPYVMAPALEVGGFDVPISARAEAGAPTPTLSITVVPGGSSTSGPSIYVDSGHHNLVQFKQRLKEHALTQKSPVLWINVDRRVPFGDWSDIREAAVDAGFRVYTAGQNPPAATPVPR